MSSICPLPSDYRTVMIYDAGEWTPPPRQFSGFRKERSPPDCFIMFLCSGFCAPSVTGANFYFTSRRLMGKSASATGILADVANTVLHPQFFLASKMNKQSLCQSRSGVKNPRDAGRRFWFGDTAANPSFKTSKIRFRKLLVNAMSLLRPLTMPDL